MRVEVMGFGEWSMCVFYTVCVCVSALRLEPRRRMGGSLKTSCPCSTSSHSVFYPRFLNLLHCLFRSSRLSADNAIRVSLHVHYASMLRPVVKMSMVRAPPQDQNSND